MSQPLASWFQNISYFRKSSCLHFGCDKTYFCPNPLRLYMFKLSMCSICLPSWWRCSAHIENSWIGGSQPLPWVDWLVAALTASSSSQDAPRTDAYDYLGISCIPWPDCGLHMVGFQNVFSQNGALIAIPWGPASKSPLNSNHTQTTGMLNMKACQLQKLWEVSSADLFRGLLSCWSCCCCCYCCC